ncbi:hypothetical protein HDV05_001277 [Chytridiales sp. JEL 0842]|nr:hypothetical protein HDV05_001277 [Chytridiales sp. JEL 0842]
MKFNVCIVTVSDRVSQGKAEDKSGPALQRAITDTDFLQVAASETVSDDIPAIQSAVRLWADDSKMDAAVDARGNSTNRVDLILTTGGTGFGVRDVTPEAISPLLHKQAPGLTTAMLTSSLKITPMASLSRPVAGVRYKTLIITLPGSPKGAIENLNAVIPVLKHALELIRGEQDAGEALHRKMQGADSSSPSPTSSLTSSTKLAAAHQHQHHGGCSHHHKKHGHRSRQKSGDGELQGNEADVESNSDIHAASSSHKQLSADLGAPVSQRHRQSPYPLTPFSEALDIVLQHSKLLPTEQRKVDTSLVGYVLAEDVVAVEAVPGYRASIVDGYAVISTDGPGVYPLAVSHTAGGKTEPTPLQPGQIARVTTGAMLPPNADAVVMVEDTELVESTESGLEEKKVRILVSQGKGDNIREVGSDVAVGELILSKGSVISAAGGEVGLLASVGVLEVTVHRHPTIAILSTGNELLPPSYPPPLPLGSVRDTNSLTLQASLQSHLPHSQILHLRTASDTPDSLLSLLREGLEKADVLLTTGGVSMGEADLVKGVLEQGLDAKVWFGRVQMKPGKPTTFATVPSLAGGERLVFALPGNPVSALVGCYVFVLPALRKMISLSNPLFPVVKAKLAHAIQMDPRPEFQRCHLVVDSTSAGGFVAHGTGSQMSSRLLSMRGANGLMKIPAKKKGGVEGLKEGEVVDVWVVGDLV